MKNKKDKTNRVKSILYYFSSVCFYIASIFDFVNKSSSMAVVHLCLVSTFLCLGRVYLNKDKEKINSSSSTKPSVESIISNIIV